MLVCTQTDLVTWKMKLYVKISGFNFVAIKQLLPNAMKILSFPKLVSNFNLLLNLIINMIVVQYLLLLD